MDFVYRLLDEMAAYSIKPPSIDLHREGFVRFKSEGLCKTNCCYYAVFRQELGAIFGCWRRDICVKWYSKEYSTLTRREQNSIRRDSERLKKIEDEKRSVAIFRANAIWNEAHHPNENHPYLRKKQIVAYYARQHGDDLVIPICDKRGQLQSIQLIKPDGFKLYLEDTSIKGGCHILGENITNPIRLCEGYATGCSIYEAIGEAVIVTFAASNLIHIAKWIRNLYPHHEIQICADDDKRAEQKIGKNVGLVNAINAAKEINAIIYYPNFTQIHGATIKHSDFNDLHVLAGIEEVENQLLKKGKNNDREKLYA